MTFATYPSLRDRVVFVTGGATGLGAAFVEHFAAQGARVAFVDVQADAGKRLAASVGASFAECDVRDIPALRAAVEQAADTLGPVTVLVNNAANDQRHPSGEVTVELWDERVQVNLRHHFFATQAVAPMMRAAGGGSVVNLGSISAHATFVDMPGYIASKAAIEGLTRTLARELGPDRIRVNCVVPGWVMTERQLTHWVTPEVERTIAQAQCLPGNLYPPDLARIVLWLAADDSRMCTGQKWVVDGGWI
jgi:NAD(P)-dependent dehydrogenase (short-subunit alcohol dehydrogenase family)